MTKKTTAPQEETQEVKTQAAVELTINDLAALKSIIDVAAQRGSFKPAEMTAVGAVYNKLSGFLDGIAKQQAAQEEAQPVEE